MHGTLIYQLMMQFGTIDRFGGKTISFYNKAYLVSEFGETVAWGNAKQD